VPGGIEEAGQRLYRGWTDADVAVALAGADAVQDLGDGRYRVTGAVAEGGEYWAVVRVETEEALVASVVVAG
jgi:hypothetical protein